MEAWEDENQQSFSVELNNFLSSYEMLQKFRIEYQDFSPKNDQNSFHLNSNIKQFKIALNYSREIQENDN